MHDIINSTIQESKESIQKEVNNMVEKDNTMRNFILGTILIGIGFAIYYFRPYQSCVWYDLICSGSNILMGPIYVIAALAFLGVGLVVILKGVI